MTLETLRGWCSRYWWLVLSLTMLTANLATYWGLPGGMETVFRFLDGPLYVYVAKTLYLPYADLHFVDFGMAPEHFSSYLPAYPFLIRLLSLITLGDYQWAMVLATNLSAMLAVVLFYRVLVVYDMVVSPLWTAVLFCFFPARWFIYHSVGASEPLFLCFVFAAFLADQRRCVGLVVLFILLASVTRIVGILLVPVFAVLWFLRRDWRALFLLPLSGTGLLATFVVYEHVFGSFFAYFDRQGILLSPIPFLSFKDSMGPSKEITEFYYFTYVLYGAGVLLLWRHREVFLYCAVFYVFYAFFHGDDLARMLVTIAPFALLVGYDRVLSQPAFRLALPGIIALDLFYAWGYIPWNLWPTEAQARLLELLAR